MFRMEKDARVPCLNWLLGTLLELLARAPVGLVDSYLPIEKIDRALVEFLTRAQGVLKIPH